MIIYLDLDDLDLRTHVLLFLLSLPVSVPVAVLGPTLPPAHAAFLALASSMAPLLASYAAALAVFLASRETGVRASRPLVRDIGFSGLLGGASALLSLPAYALGALLGLEAGLWVVPLVYAWVEALATMHAGLKLAHSLARLREAR